MMSRSQHDPADTASAWVDRIVTETWPPKTLSVPPKSDREEVIELSALFGHADHRQQQNYDLLHPPLNPAKCPLARMDPITEEPWVPWAGNSYHTYAKRQSGRIREKARTALPSKVDADIRQSTADLLSPKEVLFEGTGELKVQRELRKLAHVSGRQSSHKRVSGRGRR